MFMGLTIAVVYRWQHGLDKTLAGVCRNLFAWCDYHTRFMEGTAMVAQKPNVKAELKVLTRTYWLYSPQCLVRVQCLRYNCAKFDWVYPCFTNLHYVVLIGVGFSIGNHLGGRFAPSTKL